MADQLERLRADHAATMADQLERQRADHAAEVRALRNEMQAKDLGLRALRENIKTRGIGGGAAAPAGTSAEGVFHSGVFVFLSGARALYRRHWCSVCGICYKNLLFCGTAFFCHQIWNGASAFHRSL